MKYKIDFDFKKVNIEISYFKLESMTDFDFTVANLASISLSQGNNYYDEFVNFCKRKENTLVDLMRARFDYIFKPKGKNKETLLNEIKIAIEKSSKLEPQFTTVQSIYIEHDNSYIFENNILNNDELNHFLKSKFDSNTTVYSNFVIKLTNLSDENIYKICLNEEMDEMEFEDFSYVTQNQELINYAKIFIRNQSIKKLPENFNLSNCKILNRVSNEFTTLSDYLNEKSKLEFISSFKQEINNKVVMYNPTSNEVEINEIAIFHDIPFKKTKILTFAEYWNNYTFSSELRENIIKDINSVPSVVISSVISNSNTVSDLEFLFKYIDPSYNEVDFCKKIDLAIEHNQRIYSSKSYIINKLKNLTSNELYYKYITNFEPEIIDNISKSDWINLLLTINKKSKTILSSKHISELEEYLINKNLIIKQISTITGSKKYLREEINKVIKSIKNKFSGDIDMELKNEINEKINYFESWKKVIHTLVHFENHDYIKSEKSLEIINDKNLIKKIVEIKKRYSIANENNIDTLENLFDDDIVTLTSVDDLLNDIEIELNIFSKKFSNL